MWMLWLNASAFADQWVGLTHSQITFEELNEGLMTPEIVGPAYWRMDDLTVSFRFQVSNNVIPSDHQLRIIFCTENEDICQGVVITENTTHLIELSNPLGGLTNIKAQWQTSDVVEWSSADSTELVISFPFVYLDANIQIMTKTAIVSMNSTDIDTHGPDPSNGIQFFDVISIDDDGDGLSESLELTEGTDPTDGDTDDDGLSDGQEFWIGTNPLSCDTDSDGLPDGLEMGVSKRYLGTASFGCYQADADPFSVTDPVSVDSDNGGMTDSEEDINGDGKVNDWETSPNDPLDDFDSDHDGIADSLEQRCQLEGLNDRDSDGIADDIEGVIDIDNDKSPNFCDPDDDNDGIPTAIEGYTDFDDDGLPNCYDLDSDGDDIPDQEESEWDLDCDGNPEYLDINPSDGPCSDTDGDGRLDVDELICGTDPSNPDTDGDGLLDSDEPCNEDSSPQTPNWSEPKESGSNSDSGCQHGNGPFHQPLGMALGIAILLSTVRRKSDTVSTETCHL